MHDINHNIRLAYTLGYKRIRTSRGYKGFCYVKDGKTWIHNIDALKDKLGVTNDQQLVDLNYAVEDYYKYSSYSNEDIKSLPKSTARREMQGLYESIHVEEGEPVYLSDGVYLSASGRLFER